MPCYSDPPTPAEEEVWWREAKKRQDWRAWYSLTPRRCIEQWLCDALRGNPVHPDCARWWRMHKRQEENRR